MATAFKSLDQISVSMLDLLRLLQPDLDTKPGTVARDVFVDAPSSEIAKVYSALRTIANRQSIASAQGTELDRLGKNFGIIRTSGSPAQGVVVFTVNDLTSDLFIPSGTIVASQNGLSFRTIANSSFNAANASLHRSNALRIRGDLDLAGISDNFALEVGVEALTNGAEGNVGRFSVIRQTLPGVSNVVNLEPFTGGSGVESDEAYKSRLLGAFAGANLGTVLGYVNVLLGDPRVIDVLAVEPGDPLMKRDGTQVGENESGEPVVISSGSGGKVDLYVQGNDLVTFNQSWIYRDRSGRGDPTSSANNFVLGQRSINPALDFQQKRRLLLEQGTLPAQPVSNVLSLSGTSSGSNFIQAFVDENGQQQGNFLVEKDTGNLAGSPFGQDKLRFIKADITLPRELNTKGPFNSKDPLDFTDVKEINQVIQEINVSNEGSGLDPLDRSIIILRHTPVLAVLRVENVTTGERYNVIDQGLGSTGLNLSGRIKISGSTLPNINDVLRVNYIWQLTFDKAVDYDDLISNLPVARSVQDSVDWGFANRVYGEEVSVVYSGSDGYHVVVEHPVSNLISVTRILSESVTNNAGKLIVSQVIQNIFNIKDADNREVFNTFNFDGAFSGSEITLPSDAGVADGATVTVQYNVTDTFNSEFGTGSFSGNIIKLENPGNNNVTLGETLFANYIANIPSILPITNLSALPADGYDNNFIVASDQVGEQPVSFKDGELLRFSPSYLQMNIQGISNIGRLSIRGTTLQKLSTTYTVLQDGLTQNIGSLILEKLPSLSASSYIANIGNVEKVTRAGQQITGVEYVYNLNNYKIQDNTYSNTALAEGSLNRYAYTLEATSRNLAQQPRTGDTIRIEVYIATPNAVETNVISTSGVTYSKFKYLYVNRIAVSSGFIGSSLTLDGTISITPFTQPNNGNIYFVNYSYVAPKEGERLTISYNYNRLLGDLTFSIEENRPITADVLLKEAAAQPIDLSALIVVDENLTRNSQLVRQSVLEVVTNFVTSQGLNSIIDASDIIGVIAGINGVDRVTLTSFNLSGKTGLVRTLKSGKNSFFVLGELNVEIEER